MQAKAALNAVPHRVGGARRHPDRRVRLLERPRERVDGGERVVLPRKGEVFVLLPRGKQDVEGLLLAFRRLEMAPDADALGLVEGCAARKADLEPSVGEVVGEGDLLRQGGGTASGSRSCRPVPAWCDGPRPRNSAAARGAGLR